MLTILQGDCLARLRELPDESVHMCCTSPPYWALRSYIKDGAPEKPYELGLEKTPEEYVAKMVEVFREVRRVLRKDGTLWANWGDSYAAGGMGGHSAASETFHGHLPREGDRIPKKAPPGLKPKDIVGVPWRMAFALQADGWYLRSDIIWHKPSAMPESVTDRPTRAHEYIFLLSKAAHYFYDNEAVKEPVARASIERMQYGLNAQINPDPHDMRHGNSWKRCRNGETMAEVGFVDPSGRNKRSVWTVPSQAYPESHFATFPEDLIKPCILAGTSARGCCPKCGAPWQRVVEKEKGLPDSFNGSSFTRGKTHTAQSALASVGQGDRTTAVKTLGWRPTCKCGEPQTVPCTVLDPFAGSGTTGAVSLELGRRVILIELNPDYVELIKHRCAVTPGLQLA